MSSSAPGRPKLGDIPSGEQRRIRWPRLLGDSPPERPPACLTVGRPRYSVDEGLT
jgi:hypothetical protein